MANKTASEKMRIIHDTKRPMMSDYINELFDDFVELHGDRYFADDHAIMAVQIWSNSAKPILHKNSEGQKCKNDLMGGCRGKKVVL